MENHNFALKNRGNLLLFALCCIVSLLPFVIVRPFSIDWINHIWMINYFAGHMDFKLNFPLAFDTGETQGNLSPIYYGFLFYPLAGVVAKVVGADAAVRILALLLLVTKIKLYHRHFSKQLHPHLATNLTLIFAPVTVYQQTNLFTRGALTEYFAAEMILISLPLLLAGLSRIKEKGQNLDLSWAFWCLCGAMGTHPITGLFFVLLVSPIFLPMLFKRKILKILIPLLGFGITSVALLLPWLRITLATSSKLTMASSYSTLEYFPLSIDSWWSKLAPYSIDQRVLEFGALDTSTPYLIAPIALSQLLVALGFLFSGLRQKSKNLAAWIALALVFSILLTMFIPLMSPHADLGSSAESFRFDPWPLTFTSYAQFAYRLSNVLVLLCSAVVLYLTLEPSEKWHRKDRQARNRRIYRNLALVTLLASTAKTVEIIYHNSFQLPSQSYQTESGARFNNSYLLGLDRKQYLADAHNLSKYPLLYYSQFGYSSHSHFVQIEEKADAPSTLSAQVQGHGVYRLTFNCEKECLTDTTLIGSDLFHTHPPSSETVQWWVREHSYTVKSKPGAQDITIQLSPIVVYGFYFSRIVFLAWLLVNGLGAIRNLRNSDFLDKAKTQLPHDE